jgi:hypothetical protein
MLLEANMLQTHEVFIPMQEVVDLDENGVGFLSHEPELSKKRYYKIFEAENIQHQKKLKPEENGKKIALGPQYGYTSIVADYYFKPQN